MKVKNNIKEYQRIKSKERRELLKEKGICRCGKKSLKNKRSCEKCLLDAREFSRNNYRLKNGIPLNKPINTKKGPKPILKHRHYKNAQTTIDKGVHLKKLKDGFGRVSEFYTARCEIKGKRYEKKWSINKYGKESAKMLAGLQKMMWLIEAGVYDPSNGDIFSAISYTDTYKGNQEYKDCVLEAESSPWLRQYEDLS